MVDNHLDEIVNNEFVILLYRKKYNLSLRDERLLNLTRDEMLLDLTITNRFDEMLKEKSEYEDEDEDDDLSLEKIKNSNRDLKIVGFTKQDIDEFWNREL